MENNYTERTWVQLTEEQQESVNGGLNWGCAASGALIVAGVLTAQPEAVGWGIMGYVMNCTD
jgi:hypothetical protein